MKGETFFASFPPEHEAFLLGVHIKRVENALPRVKRPNVVRVTPTTPPSQEEKPNHG